jgi:hypothetical protein
MNPVKIASLLLLALLAACASSEISGQVPPSETPNNLKVTRTLKGRIEGITFFNAPFVLTWHFGANDGRSIDTWLGGDGEQPTYVVKSISLSYRGKEIVIPQDAYYDFNDPPVYGEPSVMASEDEISVFFSLSDGAGSCRVSLDFKDGQYVGRTIHRKHHP